MWGVACYFFVNFLKFIDQSFFIIQWMYLLYITNSETSILFCSRWLPRK